MFLLGRPVFWGRGELGVFLVLESLCWLCFVGTLGAVWVQGMSGETGGGGGESAIRKSTKPD